MKQNKSFIPTHAAISPPSYDAIGTGALSLKTTHLSPFLYFLSQEIRVLAKNTRPDARAKESDLLLGLKSSKEQIVAGQATPLFLDLQTGCDKEKSPLDLRFSDKATPLWIKPVSLDSQGVLIEVGGEVNQEGKTEFVLQTSNSGHVDGKEQLYSKSIKEALFWDCDMLLQEYGGEEYRFMKNKQKLDFSTYACFVVPGDYLTWNEERWRVVPLSSVVEGSPLAYIKAITSKGIDIEAWDGQGFDHLNITLQKQYAKFTSKPETMLSSVRLRTSSQISCVLGKRRMNLKPGDWLLKTPYGWHNLKRAEEIEDCINHHIRGELFIFDGLEKEGASVVLKGHLFDEMRTQQQLVSLPFLLEKKTSAKQKRRAHTMRNIK